MMRKVLLIIRGDFGTYLAIPMYSSEAMDIVHKHKNKTLPPCIGGDHEGMHWSFESSKIILCHTQEIQDQQIAQNPQTGNQKNPTYKISGY